uniref:basic salivary proline-rich protein 2-like n=1 Tax=Ictidomys tridecemlineatus TaxID=43179 RepID=UPI001A9DE570|nr:basic salivary proline-rich protein 2-like [Ictidomys tridecemlineatus]
MFIHVPPNHLCYPRRCQLKEQLWEAQSYPREVQGWSPSQSVFPRLLPARGKSRGLTRRPPLPPGVPRFLSKQTRGGGDSGGRAECPGNPGNKPQTLAAGPARPGKGPPQPRWKAARGAGAGPGPAGCEQRRNARTPPPPGPAARGHSRALPAPTRDGSSRSNGDRDGVGVRGQACWFLGPAVSGRRSEVERGGLGCPGLSCPLSGPSSLPHRPRPPPRGRIRTESGAETGGKRPSDPEPGVSGSPLTKRRTTSELLDNSSPSAPSPRPHTRYLKGPERLQGRGHSKTRKREDDGAAEPGKASHFRLRKPNSHIINLRPKEYSRGSYGKR